MTRYPKLRRLPHPSALNYRVCICGIRKEFKSHMLRISESPPRKIFRAWICFDPKLNNRYSPLFTNQCLHRISDLAASVSLTLTMISAASLLLLGVFAFIASVRISSALIPDSGIAQQGRKHGLVTINTEHCNPKAAGNVNQATNLLNAIRDARIIAEAGILAAALPASPPFNYFFRSSENETVVRNLQTVVDLTEKPFAVHSSIGPGVVPYVYINCNDVGLQGNHSLTDEFSRLSSAMIYQAFCKAQPKMRLNDLTLILSSVGFASRTTNGVTQDSGVRWPPPSKRVHGR